MSHDEIDFTQPHVSLQNIKLENIEILLLDSYRLARISANRRVQSALFNTLAGAITPNLTLFAPGAENPSDFYQSLNDNKHRLLAALDDNSPNEFKSRVVKVLRDLNETNFESAVIATPLLSRLFQNMISELDAERLALGSINLLVEKFNQFLLLTRCHADEGQAQTALNQACLPALRQSSGLWHKCLKLKPHHITLCL